MVEPKRNLTVYGQAAVVLALGAASPVGARSYSIDNVTFDDATHLSGFVSINVYGYPDGYHFTTSNGSITGYDYKPTINTSFTPGGSTIVIYRDDPAYDGFLQLTFAEALTGTGTGPDALVLGAGGPSFECATYTCTSPTANQRFLIAAGVPEVTTWAMLLAGFGGVGGLMRTARHKTTTAAA